MVHKDNRKRHRSPQVTIQRSVWKKEPKTVETDNYDRNDK